MTYEKAIEYAVKTRAAGILEKNGSYQTAKNWDEIDYAISCGWNYVGHPADLIANK